MSLTDFVFGDNYEFSNDSRYPKNRCIKKSAIIGEILSPMIADLCTLRLIKFNS